MVSMTSQSVKLRAHLEPVFSNGRQKYSDFKERKLYVSSV